MKQHSHLASEAAWGWVDAVARHCRRGVRAASTSRSPRVSGGDGCRPTSPVRWKTVSHAILLASCDWDAAKCNGGMRCFVCRRFSAARSLRLSRTVTSIESQESRQWPRKSRSSTPMRAGRLRPCGDGIPHWSGVVGRFHAASGDRQILHSVILSGAKDLVFQANFQILRGVYPEGAKGSE